MVMLWKCHSTEQWIILQTLGADDGIPVCGYKASDSCMWPAWGKAGSAVLS